MKMALLVGVNIYKRLGKDSNLNGCVNDVLNVRDVLKTFYGFTNDDIHVLVDERATKANIMERLSSMVGTASAGDKLLFHFSGHGSQIRDRDGDELADGMDEILCPHDMDWDGTYIIDDDLAVICNNLPSRAELEVLFDCCHSGTGLRALVDFLMTRESDPLGIKNRYAPPPIDILCRSEGEEKPLTIDKLLLANQYLSKPVLWAGCRSNQTSADAHLGGKYNGAFTYHLCENIRSSRGKITRADLIKRMRDDLKMTGFDQVPQLETSEPGKLTGLFLE